jgi:NADPH2:quinone reductase
MIAAWYERQGPPSKVLTVGEMPDPVPGPGEVRIRIVASGINPGDVKKLDDRFGIGMPYPRVIPHSDGAGQVDQVGERVSSDWLGKDVWCYGAQSYRPFGTAAEFAIVPATQAVPLPKGVTAAQGACLGIPGITAHRAVHSAGAVSGRTVLVQGAAGSVGQCAVQLARRAGAHVIGTIRTPSDVSAAGQAGAHEVLLNDTDLVPHLKALHPDGVDHIVEVAFGANLGTDLELLKVGGAIATYASNVGSPTIPFWPLVFNNIKIFFLGSDDFPPEAKAIAALDINAALEAGWSGFTIGQRLPLSKIAKAHELVEHPTNPGRVVLVL